MDGGIGDGSAERGHLWPIRAGGGGKEILGPWWRRPELGKAVARTGWAGVGHGGGEVGAGAGTAGVDAGRPGGAEGRRAIRLTSTANFGQAESRPIAAASDHTESRRLLTLWLYLLPLSTCPILHKITRGSADENPTRIQGGGPYRRPHQAAHLLLQPP